MNADTDQSTKDVNMFVPKQRTLALDKMSKTYASSSEPRIYNKSKFMDYENSSYKAEEREFNILLVEDDDVDSERLVRFLKKLDVPIQLKVATSGEVALDIISTGIIDIILLDYQLGDMTGGELLSELKLRKMPYIPSVMITGMGDEKTVVEALKLGISDYLPKHELTPERLLAVVNQAMQVILMEDQLKEAQEKLTRTSLYDELTGLPNRSLLFDRLQASLAAYERKTHPFYVLMLDLDLFKEINDSLGHSAGDYVLTVVGERLSSAIRKTDTIARIGGDEFVCILNEVDNLEHVEVITSNIIDAISATIKYENQVLQIGVSVGIAQCARNGMTSSILMSNADAAMYDAKKTRRRYVVFKEHDAPVKQKTLPVGNDIYEAVQNNELYMVYQPQIDLKTNQIVGVEALVRWMSPTFGQVAPDDFLLCAERTSLIKYITYATFSMVFDTINEWKLSDINIPVSINLSARMLDDVSFSTWLNDVAKANDIRPEQINIEITETALASSSGNLTTILQSLIDSNYSLSIDDFGSGYSSLKFISQFEFAELKIDKCFIDEITTDYRCKEIARSMVMMARGLKMRVVAEGVEELEQLSVVREIGCDAAQGYYFNKPMAQDDLKNILIQQ